MGLARLLKRLGRCGGVLRRRLVLLQPLQVVLEDQLVLAVPLQLLVEGLCLALRRRLLLLQLRPEALHLRLGSQHGPAAGAVHLHRFGLLRHDVLQLCAQLLHLHLKGRRPGLLLRQRRRLAVVALLGVEELGVRSARRHTGLVKALLQLGRGLLCLGAVRRVLLAQRRHAEQTVLQAVVLRLQVLRLLSGVLGRLAVLQGGLLQFRHICLHLLQPIPQGRRHPLLLGDRLLRGGQRRAQLAFELQRLFEMLVAVGQPTLQLLDVLLGCSQLRGRNHLAFSKGRVEPNKGSPRRLGTVPLQGRSLQHLVLCHQERVPPHKRLVLQGIHRRHAFCGLLASIAHLVRRAAILFPREREAGKRKVQANKGAGGNGPFNRLRGVFFHVLKIGRVRLAADLRDVPARAASSAGRVEPRGRFGGRQQCVRRPGPSSDKQGRAGRSSVLLHKNRAEQCAVEAAPQRDPRCG